MRTTKDIKDVEASEFRLDKNQNHNYKTATFALGCFWGPDAVFGGLEGVIRTRVGYAGGEKANPTYRNLGSHTETLKVDYNPDLISYEELLEVFWEHHNPRTHQKTQYASKIFYMNDEQRKIAEESLEERNEDGNVLTEVEELETFWIAEDYHQKYYLRQSKDLISLYEEVYSPEKIINSTSAAKMNAWVSGKMSSKDKPDFSDQLSEMIESS